jgi:hypothetical protein
MDIPIATPVSDDDEIRRLRAIMARYKDSNGLIRHLNARLTEQQQWVVNRLLNALDYEGIWEFHIIHKIQVKVSRPSIIKEYTNKKGKTHLAHFSHYDKYLGSVKSKGETPIPADYWIIPDRENFTLSGNGVFKEITYN